ncbi:MAG: tRNA-specific 2-thiouridylase [Acidimicrobiales bacterium]|jgi:tRNA-uridine 2-sulfurtransferase
MAEVLVAMSGGVDSSVAAALLKQQGHDVVGVTLKLWGGESDSGCCSVSDVEDARRVAQQLDIDHHVFNFGDDFDRHVIEPYVEAYDQGRTPNPCIECNRHIKFDKLLRRADALGFELIATGHHARIETDADGVHRIARGADPAKDQSYVLHMLGQDQLRRLLLPVGDLTKDGVREMAHELGLRTADKPDSQDVCFIHSDGGRRAFLGDRIPLSPAVIVDREGRQLGHTDAVQLVTIGQRKGLGLAGNDNRHYITEIDRPNGIVTVGTEEQTKSGETALVDVGWSSDPVTAGLTVQCSAHGSRLPGRVLTSADDRAQVIWDEPHRRVAAGQAVVFYVGDEVVGGATAS